MMRIPWKAVGVVALAMLACSGWAAGASLQVVFVRHGTPTVFSLAAGGGGEVAYSLIELPANGTLVGIPPYLTYVPRPGFAGDDWVQYLVQSGPGQWDLGTVRLVVLSPGATTTPFVLTSEGEMVWSGPTFAVDGYRLVVGVQAQFTYFEQVMRATFTDAGFTSLVGVTRLTLEGDWPSPWRLPITSTLDFDPTIPGLKSWTINATTTLFGATWATTFYYSGTDPQTGSYTTFQVQGIVGPFTFDSRTTFVTLTPTFGEQRLILKGPWICEGCPTNWELEFLATKAGFEHLSFLIKDVEVPCGFCGSIRILFDSKITFKVDEKTVEPELRIGSGIVACVRPYLALPTPTSPFGFTGIEVYGIEIRCETEGGYTLRLATSFSPPKDSAITGDLRFFELWQLEGPVVPCCGNPGRFQMTAYFKRESGSLFGLGMGNIVVFVPLSRELLVNIGLKVGEVDPVDPTKRWILTVGWRGIW